MNALPTADRHPLICHPDSSSPAGLRLEVAARLDANGLALRYFLRGAAAGLRLPPPRPATAADGLWQHTCCEAFLALDGEGYREFNFSPSGEWAVYDFSAYRTRSEHAVATAPAITLRRSEDSLELSAFVAPALLPSLRHLRLGLSAVVEAADGGRSYWALRHEAGPADFHRRQNFTLILKANSP